MKELSHIVLERLLRSPEFGFDSTHREASGFIDESVAQDVCKSNNADLEIAFRGVLSSTLEGESGIVDGAEAYDRVKMLIEFSCEIAKQVHSSEEDLFGDNSRRIPCILLEDLLEWQTIAQIDRTWKLVMEPLTEMLTHESVFGKGSTILLRVCNGILRRLSRSVDTELRGRVLMFLAYIFPISERSAVNLYGKNNTTNVTHFDTKEAYIGAADDSNNDIGNENGSSDNESKASEREVGEEYMDLEEMAPVADDESKGAEVDPYTEYRDFWTLQNLLSADLKTTKPAELRSSMNKVLSSLERHTSTQYTHDDQVKADAVAATKCAAGESTSASGSGSEARAGVGKGEGAANIGQKYLTDSQLFVLELADSQFRQQVCIQILMACQHLRFLEEDVSQNASPPTSSTAAAAGAGSDASSGKGKVGKGEDKERERERAEAEKAFAKLMLLKGIETRAFAALANSLGGPRLCEALKQMLYRETFWKAWKRSACPPLEDRKRKDVPVPGSSSLSSSTGSVGERGGGDPLGKGGEDFRRKWLLQTGDLRRSDWQWSRDLDAVNAQAWALSSGIPSYSGHIEAYKEADDPEAGIEEEYHPKHDALYCWRARRLMAADHVRAFREMHDGDLSKGIAYVEAKGEGTVADGQSIRLQSLRLREAPTYPSKGELAEAAKKNKNKKKAEDEGKKEEKMKVEEEGETDVAKGYKEDKDGDEKTEPNTEQEQEQEQEPEDKSTGKGKSKGRGRATSKAKDPSLVPAAEEKKEAPGDKGKKRKRK